MQLSNIITPDRILSSLDGASKKRVLELTAEFIAEESQIDSERLSVSLTERLGSTESVTVWRFPTVASPH